MIFYQDGNLIFRIITHFMRLVFFSDPLETLQNQRLSDVVKEPVAKVC